MYDMTLESIPAEQFDSYRLKVIFDGYKWDPQVGDTGTVAAQALTIGRSTAAELAAAAEQLAAETVAMEQALLTRPDLVAQLGLPWRAKRALAGVRDYSADGHVRLMRFDFHPTRDGWMISEVNSDVPGGLAEASVLPAIAQRFFEGYSPYGNPAHELLGAFARRLGTGAALAFVYATSYSDDRQVMQFLADQFTVHGAGCGLADLRTVFIAPDHIRWDGGRAYSMLEGCEGPLGGIVRFYPAEWMPALPGGGWRGFFSAITPSCNHPVALLTQSKRLPLVWDKLGLPLPAWRRLLPETLPPTDRRAGGPGFILKPALGRVGEDITIVGSHSATELRDIKRGARLHPRDWVAQRMFESIPLPTADGESRHLCLGVFTVDGKFAGFYGRMSDRPHIDARAREIPVLVRDSDI